MKRWCQHRTDIFMNCRRNVCRMSASWIGNFDFLYFFCSNNFFKAGQKNRQSCCFSDCFFNLPAFTKNSSPYIGFSSGRRVRSRLKGMLRSLKLFFGLFRTIFVFRYRKGKIMWILSCRFLRRSLLRL